MHLTLLLSIILIAHTAQAQTAEELWTTLQARYEGLENYVDHGRYTRIIYGINISTTTYDYTVAVDSQQNVWHSISKWEIPEADVKKYPWSYTYQKTADQKVGVMIRNLGSPEELPRTLNEACASLYAVGGGVLHQVAGLMFPLLYEDSNDGATGNFRIDSLIRARDTLVNAEECFVLEMINSTWISEEMIRENERRQDSILNQKTLQYPIPERPKQEPFTSTFRTRYMIRKSDGLICRREVTHLRNEEVWGFSEQSMDPRVNVKGFQKYLWTGKS